MNSPIIAILAGGEVSRYHQMTTLPRQQSNGEHTWRMAALALTLYGGVAENLLPALIFHDASESLHGGTGDLPSQVKWALEAFGTRDVMGSIEKSWRQDQGIQPWFDRLTPEDERRLAFLDKIECLMFACDQLALGNRNFALVGNRVTERIQQKGLAQTRVERICLQSWMLHFKLCWDKVEGDSEARQQSIKDQARFMEGLEDE